MGAHKIMKKWDKLDKEFAAFFATFIDFLQIGTLDENLVKMKKSFP